MISEKTPQNESRKYLTPEEAMSRLSRSHLEADKKRKKLPEDLYKKIIKEGVPCYWCHFVINENTFGHTEITDEGPKPICWYCDSPLDQ